MITQMEAIKILKAHSEGEVCSSPLVDVHFEFVNFKNYDFNNLNILGGRFEFCDLSEVYMSGTNLGGSSFVHSGFKNNRIVKAEWNDVIVVKSNFDHIFNFRTDMMEADISNTIFDRCVFGKMSFFESVFKNVIFVRCVFSGVKFNDCCMDNVSFVDCFWQSNENECIKAFVDDGTVMEQNSHAMTASSENVKFG